jgi:flagellar protein FlbD
MIRVTRITGESYYLNPDHIKSIESAGDTVVTLTTGERILLRDSADELAEMFLNYKMRISGVMVPQEVNT